MGIPLALILIIKLMMENLVVFAGFLTCAFVLYRTKAQFSHLLALKITHAKGIAAMCVMMALVLVEVVILYTMLNFCGVSEPVWQRLLLFVSTDPELGFLSIAWKCLLVDMYAELVITFIQIVACFSYLLYFFLVHRHRAGYSHVNTTDDVETGSESRILLELIRRPRDANVADIAPRPQQPSSTTSSDMEDKYNSEIFLSEKRMCLLISIAGLIYRCVLPVCRIFIST
jgi:hypothetical protein